MSGVVRGGFAGSIIIIVGAAAAGQDGGASIDRVAVAVHRRALEVQAIGRVATGTPADGLVARVVRGECGALATGVTVRGGEVRVDIRVEARLLPDEYSLELAGADGHTIARRTFRVGAADEVAPARARLRAWLDGARGALRELAVGLERRGRFHAALSLATRANPVPQLEAWAAFVDGWNGRLRAARMDFSAYERELALPPFPDAGAALGKLFGALHARCLALGRVVDDASRGQEPRPGDADDVLALARAAAGGLGEAAFDAEAWSAGPSAEPERGAVRDGVFRSPLGFSLTPLADWKERRTNKDPEERVRFEAPGEREGPALVLVHDLPADAADDAAVERLCEVRARESFSSYKRFEGGALADGRRGCRRIFTAVEGGKLLKALEVDLRDRRSIVSLICVASPERFDARREQLERLAASFALDGGPR